MYIITLNGNLSELSCNIFRPLEVDKTIQLCLLSLQTNNSIPNIEPGCNIIGFKYFLGIYENITITTELFVLAALETVINLLMPDFVTSSQTLYWGT